MQLVTDRLILRVIEPEDWQALKRIVRNFDASPYAPYDHPFPESDLELQNAARCFSESGAFHVAVLRGSGDVIGYVSLWPDGDALSLGYCFHSDYHGRGYGFEACSSLMNRCIQNGITRFVCGTALANKPSMRLIQKLGFELIGVEQLAFRKDASGQDIVFTGGQFVRSIDAPK